MELSMTKINKVVFPEPERLPIDGMSRFSQFKKFLPISREKFRQLVRDGKAPQAVRMGIRCTMWHNREIHQFLADPLNYKRGSK